jgi:hypothetical protein
MPTNPFHACSIARGTARLGGELKLTRDHTSPTMAAVRRDAIEGSNSVCAFAFLGVSVGCSIAGCGPRPGGPIVSSTDTGGGGTVISDTNTADGSSTTSESSSGSTGSGSDPSCEGWTPPSDPGWSWMNCRDAACPEGEVCRFDPSRGCDADPVCVNPTTYECNCELYDPNAQVACACPDYEGPLNGAGRAVLECNTGMSQSPVYNAFCGV